MSQVSNLAYLTGKFTNASIDLPCKLPNLPFAIPKNAPYGEFHIIKGPQPVVIAGEGAKRRGGETTNKARVRYVGFVQLTVWVPEGKGTKGAAEAGDKFKAIYQFRKGRDSSGDIFRFGALQPFTPQTKTGYDCTVFRVPYEMDTLEEVQVSI